MRIRELNEKSALIYRVLRLKGLKEEPASFDSTYEDEEQLTINDFEEYLKQPNQIVFGAFEEADLVGILTLSIKCETKRAHIAKMTSLYVYDEYKEQGISNSLIASAIMRARELKCEQIHLSVNIENKHAKSLYISFGFEIIGMEKEILKISENKYIDEYRMALYFDEWKEA